METKSENKKTKTGGRQRGTPNKTTKQLRTVYHDLIQEKLPDLITSSWDTLENTDKWNII